MAESSHLEEKPRLVLRVPAEVRSALEQMARKNHRCLSGEASYLIEQAAGRHLAGSNADG